MSKTTIPAGGITDSAVTKIEALEARIKALEEA